MYVPLTGFEPATKMLKTLSSTAELYRSIATCRRAHTVFRTDDRVLKESKKKYVPYLRTVEKNQASTYISEEPHPGLRPGSRCFRTPNGIRTRATSVKERRPSPLDDRGEKTCTASRELPETRYRLEPSRKAPRHNWVLCQLSYTPIEEVMGVEPTTSQLHHFICLRKASTKPPLNVRPMGLEPMTCGLKVRSSTN